LGTSRSNRFQIAGALVTWWEQQSDEFKTFAARGFDELVDGWVDTIRDVIEGAKSKSRIAMPPANVNSCAVCSLSIFSKWKRRRLKSPVWKLKRRKPDGHFLRKLKAKAKKAGVEGAELHRFRKTYADTLHEEGVSVNTIRIRLGHESLDVTLAYLKGKDAESEEAQEHANSSSLALYA